MPVRLQHADVLVLYTGRGPPTTVTEGLVDVPEMFEACQDEPDELPVQLGMFLAGW